MPLSFKYETVRSRLALTPDTFCFKKRPEPTAAIAQKMINCATVSSTDALIITAAANVARLTIKNRFGTLRYFGPVGAVQTAGEAE